LLRAGGSASARLFHAAVLVSAVLLPATWTRAEQPPTPGIRILVLKSEAEARAALADMHAGVPFARLVRERSIGPARDRGGYLGRMDPASLSPEIRTAVAKTPRGRISPIFRTEDGFAVVQVVTSQEEQELEARAGRESEAQASLEQGTKLGEGGNLEGAESLLRRATELNPDLAAAHYNLAIVYRKRQRLDEVIAAMRWVV
jgi:tetratricopeptide (TPR) repeat protein